MKTYNDLLCMAEEFFDIVDDNNQPLNRQLGKVERDESPEIPESTPRPGLLDIVQIDGRWAQVLGGGDAVKFLDDDSMIRVEWDEYILVRKFNHPCDVGKYLEFINPNGISASEVLQIRFDGKSEIDHPELKLKVTVFGIYKKRLSD